MSKITNDLTKYQAASIEKWDFDMEELKLIEPKDEIAKAALNKFINRNGSPIDVHRTNGRRVFNPFTAMKRSHRKYVSFQGSPLIEIDAKNSHPLIMVQKMIEQGLDIEPDLKVAVESGTFYDYLAQDGKTRNEIKDSWFSFCYNKTINKQHPIYNRLNTIFPKFIESFAIYAKDRSLSEYLQELESRIWIDSISNALMRAGINHITIHDSVVFAGVQYVNKVLDIVEASFGGVSPPLHVDYLNGDKVDYVRVVNLENAKFLSADFVLIDELHKCKVDPFINIDKPDAAVYMIDGDNFIPMFTLGNFSTISGRSKSGKTLLISAIVASALSSGKVIGKFMGDLPANKLNILHIDTEQSAYDFQWVAKRVIKMADVTKEEVENHITFYRMREKDTTKRIELIDISIKNTPNLGLVIIDGIRDLVFDINNSEESTTAMGYLMKWTDKYNIHILTVLHQNPGKDTGNKLRGHIGTEAMNKAETVISVNKKDGEDFGMVNGDFMRRETFKPFGIKYDKETNLPIIIGNVEIDLKKVREHFDISDAEHSEIINKLFSRTDKHNKTEFLERGKNLMLMMKYDVTRRGFENIFNHWINEGVIHERRIKNTRYITLEKDEKNSQLFPTF